MSKSEEIFHSHVTMERLLGELRGHLNLLWNPLLGEAEGRVILEEARAFLVLFDHELRGHVEFEEREMYPVLKEHLADESRAKLVALYEDHRMLEASVLRLGFGIRRLLGRSEIVEGYQDIMVLADELFALFEVHSVHEHQIFMWAGLEHEY